MEQISSWFKNQLSNPQVVFLTASVLVLFLIVVYAGHMLAPVLAGIVIAYLLEGIIKRMGNFLPRTVRVWLVFLGFMFFLVIVVFGLLPTLYNQLTQVVAQIPSMLSKGQTALMTLPERYPDLFSQDQVGDIVNRLRADLTTYGRRAVTGSLSGAASLIGLLIYVIVFNAACCARRYFSLNTLYRRSGGYGSGSDHCVFSMGLDQ